ncbi:zinc ribbon domain-containing protein [Dictyobacter kobayashii]|uniref:zinc ribbon domain-containing protein n=1 Tax=Dictyobacter kobayashii TaxID=2014872 RepID=UPI00138678BD|nr:zinc ribbon domain-containing protein [Dictyobacter kobayashii]
MAQTLYVGAAITLVSISFIYIAVFLCALIVFLLSLFLLQRASSKQCQICLKRLRHGDNFCPYCGTASHPIVAASKQVITQAESYPQQTPPHPALYGPTAPLPPTSYPTQRTPRPVPISSPPSDRYISYHDTIDDPNYLCPTCRGPLHLSDTFCGNCGGRLVPSVNQIRSR